jgi:hypothetical protein
LAAVLDGSHVGLCAVHELCGINEQHCRGSVFERVHHLLSQPRVTGKIRDRNVFAIHAQLCSAHCLGSNGAEDLTKAQTVECASFATSARSQKQNAVFGLSLPILPVGFRQEFE